MIHVRDAIVVSCHSGDMRYFNVSTVNSTIVATATLGSAAHADEALAIGTRGAIAIATEEVTQGSPVAAVEVTISDEDGKALRRVVVSLSVAPLIVA